MESPQTGHEGGPLLIGSQQLIIRGMLHVNLEIANNLLNLIAIYHFILRKFIPFGNL